MSATAAKAKPGAVRRPGFIGWFGDVGWRHLVGLAAVAFATVPFLFVLSTSLSNSNSLQGGGLLPSNLTFKHYRWLFSNDTDPYGNWLRNTLLISTLSAFGTVIVAALGAFPFSRMRFRGRKGSMLFLLLSQMFPATLLVVAVYLLVLDLKVASPVLGPGSLVVVMLVYLGGALGGNVWLMKSFFDTLPVDLDESAKVDGATHGQVFFRIILPLAAPILATIFLFSFIFSLNEIVIAGALLRGDPGKFTLPYGMGQFVQGRESNWGRFAAGAIVASVPVLIVFQFLQRYLTSGLTQGAVKG